MKRTKRAAVIKEYTYISKQL